MFIAPTDNTDGAGLCGPGLPTAAVNLGATRTGDECWLLPGSTVAERSKTDQAVRLLLLSWRSIHSVLRRVAGFLGGGGRPKVKVRGRCFAQGGLNRVLEPPVTIKTYTPGSGFGGFDHVCQSEGW